MSKSVEARLDRLERAVRERTRRPVLLLKTFDGGQTYGGPDGQTYTDADLPKLDGSFDVVVVEYVEDWRSPVRELAT